MPDAKQRDVHALVSFPHMKTLYALALAAGLLSEPASDVVQFKAQQSLEKIQVKSQAQSWHKNAETETLQMEIEHTGIIPQFHRPAGLDVYLKVAGTRRTLCTHLVGVEPCQYALLKV